MSVIISKKALAAWSYHLEKVLLTISPLSFGVWDGHLERRVVTVFWQALSDFLVVCIKRNILNRLSFTRIRHIIFMAMYSTC